MTVLSVEISHFQHLVDLRVEIDTTIPGIACYVGRNGVGKTTLVRALRNLSNADTFIKSASPHAFYPDSKIVYRIDDQVITFVYDAKLRSLNSRDRISDEIRGLVVAELPLPHGRRFNFHRSASDADSEIRQGLVLGSYERPEELIEFLRAIYDDDRFASLVEVKVRGQNYYAVIRDDGRYIREDHLSSGEYFLINLYRTIKSGARLIVVDELDISLDAAAQVRVAAWLREFCSRYECKLVFTTHSLALMRTLKDGELHYLEAVDGVVTDILVSYSYVKARLFGFTGWDRYVLTEDIVLSGFLNFLISTYCVGGFLRSLVIYVGGAPQVIDLMSRNAQEQFLSSPENVISVLDGDQRQQHNNKPSVLFVPFDNVETAVFEHKADDGFPFVLPEDRVFQSAKELYNYLGSARIANAEQINQYLCQTYMTQLTDLIRELRNFLGALPTMPQTGFVGLAHP